MIHKALAVTFTALLFITLSTSSCSGQTEEQALQSLRQLTKDGKLPAESVVETFERRFSGRPSGTLARLLHARIKFENKDFAGAAKLLDTEDFAKKTKLGDYALWLRGQALQSAGDYSGAMSVYERLQNEYPNSIRVNDTKLKSAESAISAGRAAAVPAMLADMTAARNANALLLTAKAFEAAGDQPNAITFYRRTYFFGAGSDAAKEAEVKLPQMAQLLTPMSAEEVVARAERLYALKNWVEADKAFATLMGMSPTWAEPAMHLKRLVTLCQRKEDGRCPDCISCDPAEREGKRTGLLRTDAWICEKQALAASPPNRRGDAAEVSERKANAENVGRCRLRRARRKEQG
jgi:tetratricopeptide (TPR) repeat protein